MYKDYEAQMDKDVTREDIINTFNRTHIGQSPELDKITNFGQDFLSSRHKLMTNS